VLLAEAQDFSGTDNANMQTPADGESPIMQMYVFLGNDESSVTLNPVTPGFDAGVVRNPVGADFGTQSFDVTQQLAVVNDGGACLINSLTAEDFTATETDRYARPGRIPGSLNVPVFDLLDVDGRFRSPDELREHFADVLARPGRKITYCGGGIAATADALALYVLGETDVAVYDGSLREWTADERLPLEVG
jgi:3-mercaptopyruvate sulfurtransferase SseA